MTAKRSFTILPFAVLALTAATLADAAAPPSVTATIAARQANFKKMGKAMKILSDQLKSSAPSQPAMYGAAQVIASNARRQGRMFPLGTGPGSGVETEALPAIWTDKADFDAKMRQLVNESTKLVAVTKAGNAAAIGAQLKATGGTCGACHRKYRAEDE
ncbi:cytochrome c [Novosphingobium sp. Chol11]|uniref:c-type cytochrome n=1 Tax=Novosphingobium sp. Chol11 TaxID=1385763 RepID=UPI0025CC0DC8|nr:cytochrome c [Novosphingobium sp. Chol11]